MQHSEIKRLFEKELEQRLDQKLPFMQVLLGPRQVGKTTAVRRVFERYKGPKHMISADDPTPKSAEWLKLEWQQAQQLGDGCLFVVDEIQKVTGWAETLKALYDPIRNTKKLQIILLGSASLSIQQGLSAALTGRFEVIKATHWDIGESNRAFDWNVEQYLSFGGYPAAALLISDELRWKNYILNSIIEPVLGRDIAGLVPISKPALFRQTFEIAMRYPAQVISYNKLLGQLQEGGNTSTVRHYLELMQGAFLIRLLPRFSGGKLQRRTSSPKIVPLAPALPQAYRSPRIAPSDPTWRGRILEAAIGAHLLTLPGQWSYWSEGDFEVDFVWEHEGRLTAFEVKSSRTRKPKSLERFRKRFPHAEPRILYENDLATINEIFLFQERAKPSNVFSS